MICKRCRSSFDEKANSACPKCNLSISATDKSSFQLNYIRIFLGLTIIAIIGHIYYNLFASPFDMSGAKVIYSLLLYIQLACWCIWSYSHTRSLNQLNPDFKIKPLFAILGWIIPIINLYLPYSYTSKIWKSYVPSEKSIRNILIVGIWGLFNLAVQIVYVLIIFSLTGRLNPFISFDDYATLALLYAPLLIVRDTIGVYIMYMVYRSETAYLQQAE